ncbi:restriction endonuclease [Streptococcus suis]|uniref:restriction endonuclease n=3 Tax=Streptococcus suis TaxID=1307 RepID=UPI0009A20657|nr:restriction endonuclease [Streptococcus suis]
MKLVGKGEDFEKVIADICSWLSMKERVNAKINTKVHILGDDGTTHEIDVLYTFEHFGISYQVGVECKNWKNPINVGELRNFDYKLNHIGGISGIFVSAESEFQNGARKVSEYNGIKLVKYEDFAVFAMSEYIKYLKPDFNTIGDPFWMLMNTGGNTPMEQNSILPNKILLFSSKKIAEDYKTQEFENNNDIIVVGVSQEHLKEIKKFNEHDKVHVYLIDFTADIVELSQWDIDLYIR